MKWQINSEKDQKYFLICPTENFRIGFFSSSPLPQIEGSICTTKLPEGQTIGIWFVNGEVRRG